MKIAIAGQVNSSFWLAEKVAGGLSSPSVELKQGIQPPGVNPLLRSPTLCSCVDTNGAFVVCFRYCRHQPPVPVHFGISAGVGFNFLNHCTALRKVDCPKRPAFAMSVYVADGQCHTHVPCQQHSSCPAGGATHSQLRPSRTTPKNSATKIMQPLELHYFRHSVNANSGCAPTMPYRKQEEPAPRCPSSRIRFGLQWKCLRAKKLREKNLGLGDSSCNPMIALWLR